MGRDETIRRDLIRRLVSALRSRRRQRLNPRPATPSPKSKVKGCLLAIAIGVGVLIVVGVCVGNLSEPGPVPCPSADEGTFDLDFTVKFRIEQEVKDLLRDPDTFKLDEVYTRGAYVTRRADGTTFYSTVEVEFRGENLFGAMVPGLAVVDLEEVNGACQVASARIP